MDLLDWVCYDMSKNWMRCEVLARNTKISEVPGSWLDRYFIWTGPVLITVLMLLELLGYRNPQFHTLTLLIFAFSILTGTLKVGLVAVGIIVAGWLVPGIPKPNPPGFWILSMIAVFPIIWVAKSQIYLNGLKSILNLALDMILTVDPRTMKFNYASRGALEKLGYRLDELKQMKFYEIQGPAEPIPWEMIEEALEKDPQTPYRFETDLIGQGKRVVHAEILLQRFQLNGIRRLVVMAHDITDRSRTQQQLEYLALHDPLTGLPNRMAVTDTINQRLAEGLDLAIFFLDFDRFKRINDSLGHVTGDRLLKLAAQRLQQSLGAPHLVARMGGDEFIIISEFSRANAYAYAQRLVEMFRRPIDLDERQFYLPFSIGVAMSPGDGTDADTLLKNADTAMYAAKQQGGQGFCFYQLPMNELGPVNLALENDLRMAVKQNQLVLHYQPQVDWQTRQVVGFEALVRWNNPEKGMLSPDRFIPVAEEIGFINELGRWVLITALEQSKKWRDQGHRFRIAVNLSPRQLHDPSFVDLVREAVADSGIPPVDVELEITENAMLFDPEETVRTLRRLADLGVRISLDDFGTGFSSMSRLQQFPINALKIDRMFVRGLESRPMDTAICSSLIALGSNLGMTLIAEGVETPSQRDMLLLQGCHIFQGFLFGRPLPPQSIDFDAVIPLTGFHKNEAR